MTASAATSANNINSNDTTVAEPDIEWRELGDLFDTTQDSAPPVTLDALHVHLNGDLALADLDEAIPLDLTDLPTSPDIKEEPSVTMTTNTESTEPKIEPIMNSDSSMNKELVTKTEPKPVSTMANTTNAVISPVRRTRPPTTTVANGRVEKKQPSCTLKEKREREARQFPSALLRNLDGTTSAEVRKMSTEERELVLYKRKLRNRESARRSRQKRQATLADLHDEIGELATVAKRMVDLGASLHSTNVGLLDKLDLAHAEIRALRAAYDHPKNKAGA